MRARRVALIVAFALAGAACGLDVVGGATSSSAPPSADAGAGDDAASIIVTDDAGPGASDDQADAQIQFDPDAACGTVTIDDPLSAVDTNTWEVVKNGAAGSDPSPSKVQSTRVVDLLDGTSGDARAAIWLKSPVPFRSMDATLEIGVGCGWYSCADGMALVWLDTTSTAVLPNASQGSTFGIPSGVSGGAVAVDVYSNGNESTPAVRILSIDGTKTPGGYDWAVANGPRDDYLVGYARTLGVHMHGGKVDVTVDDKPVASAPVSSDFKGLFGLTAATGGQSARFAVWKLHARFSACDP